MGWLAVSTDSAKRTPCDPPTDEGRSRLRRNACSSPWNAAESSGTESRSTPDIAPTRASQAPQSFARKISASRDFNSHRTLPSPPGETLALDLEIDDEWIHLDSAQVVWSKPAADEGAFLNGLQFEMLDADLYRRIVMVEDSGDQS